GGEVGESVEGVLEILDPGSIGQSEPQVIRGDHAVLLGQQRDEPAEHGGARGVPVQKHESGCMRGAGLAVEKPVPLDFGVAVMDDSHDVTLSSALVWLPHHGAGNLSTGMRWLESTW